MKKTISVLIAFFLIINYSCKEKIDLEKEKAAIMAVIEEETASYYASDFERWSATYQDDSTAIRMASSKFGYSLTSGWEAITVNMKQTILNKRELAKEIKKYYRIKIYGETAWVVFDNLYYNNKGEATGNQLTTCFLEKQDGNWKIVFRDALVGTGYYQADQYILNSISYAKSLGKNVEDIAGFMADQFKTSWDKTVGYSGFVNTMLGNWRNVVPKGELKILEQDDNHIVFSANNMLPGLKRGGPQYNVTYDDYLTFYKVFCTKYSDYMGATYNQETTPDGVLITIGKQ